MNNVMYIYTTTHLPRWTTCQNGCCRLYLSEEDPSPALQRIVNFIVFVYGPVFLDIRHKSRVQQAPNHLVKEIMLIKQHCTEEEKVKVCKAVQDNGFMAHHESVLLSLLGSEDRSDRDFAVDLILQIRDLGDMSWPAKSHGIRPVQVINSLESQLIVYFSDPQDKHGCCLSLFPGRHLPG